VTLLRTRAALGLAAALLLAPAITAGFDLGGAALKAWEKRDAIIKTSKALRKGFADLTAEEEYYIGRAVAARLLADYKPVEDKARTAYLNTVGQMLAAYSERPETFAGYHFLLVRSDEINAFAAPGGFVLVTTGLYGLARNEEELAAVLAHEIAHVSLRHGLRAIKSANLTEAFTIIGTEAAKEYTRGQIAKLTSIFESSIDDVVKNMVSSGYSRDQEYAADKEAARILYRAGYNPAGLPGLLEAMRDTPRAATKTGFYATHPVPAERLARVEETIQDQKLDGATAAPRTSRFGKYAIK